MNRNTPIGAVVALTRIGMSQGLQGRATRPTGIFLGWFSPLGIRVRRLGMKGVNI